jgi:hypothetical protein
MELMMCKLGNLRFQYIFLFRVHLLFRMEDLFLVLIGLLGPENPPTRSADRNGRFLAPARFNVRNIPLSIIYHSGVSSA